MNHYRKLAIRYLKMNKKRSVITILGVVVAVTVLYTALNLGWSALLTQRKELRAEQDYEIVFMTENQNQIDQIVADSKVKSASLGTYYDYDYYEPAVYENALYVNTTNPYRMEKIQKELEKSYGVNSELNDPLAWTYLQGGEDNATVIMILMSLLVSFIFAIFGVGVVRNSIQLSVLEQIKDYGNMRCIGATKGQLKSIIYIEGAILELTGNVIGILGGFVISYIVGSFLKWEVGLHVIPMIPILIAFLGDLYFAMDENCKIVSNMTPISAIRGEFRIRKEKIKIRKKSIFGRLFGVEGDYAYKSVMRNPGRFYKTVWALGIAVAAFITIVGCANSIDSYVKETEDSYKYYQVYFENIKEPYETWNEVQNTLPSTDVFENMKDLEEVTSAKRIYSSRVSLVDGKEFIKHYTEEYVANGPTSNMLRSLLDETEEIHLWAQNWMSTIECYGYDETDYKRYEDMLVDGTLDISEDGIVLINSGTIETYDMDALMPQNVEMTYTDYQVGDTIRIVDMQKLQELLKPELEKLEEEYQKEWEALPKDEEKEYSITRTPEDELNSKYNDLKQEIYLQCRQQLIEEGSYETYTIEGILRDDVNHMNYGVPRFVLPLEKYYAISGTDESKISGMQYHFDKFSYTRYLNALDKEASNAELFEDIFLCDYSMYPDFMYLLEGFKKPIIGTGIAILFVVLMSTFNIINTTASNLHLRKKELAQLRVLGVSKKRLMKMVMLEGVISSIVANGIGILLGALLSYFMIYMIFGILFGVEYAFPIGAAIVGVIVSTFILCGSVYAPLRELKQDIAGDLALGGE